MTHATAKIDQLMEQASRALEATDYLVCERLCMEAMALARETEDFDRLARIALPLQEARRQRRQIAEDAGVFVCTGKHPRRSDALLQAHPVGCLLLTDPPYDEAEEQAIRDEARRRGAMVEVLRLDHAALLAAFCQAMEHRGDQLLADAARQNDPVQRVDAILEKLETIGDHEIAHQRLADAARDAARTQAR